MSLLLHPDDLVHVMSKNVYPMRVRDLALEVGFSEASVWRCLYKYPKKFKCLGGKPMMWTLY